MGNSLKLVLVAFFVPTLLRGGGGGITHPIKFSGITHPKTTNTIFVDFKGAIFLSTSVASDP